MSGVPLVPISPPLRHARLYAPHGSWCRPETRGALPVRDAGLFTGCPPPPTRLARAPVVGGDEPGRVPEVLFEAQLEGLADGADDILSKPFGTLQDVAGCGHSRGC